MPNAETWMSRLPSVVTAHPDGRSVVLAGLPPVWDMGVHRGLYRWDYVTSRLHSVLPESDARPFRSIALHPHGNVVAITRESYVSGSWAPLFTPEFWDLNTGQELPWDLASRQPEVGSYGEHWIFSPDGRWLANVGLFGESFVWDLRNPHQFPRKFKGGERWEKDHGQNAPLAFSPDSRELAIGKFGGSVEIVDAKTGALKQVLHFDRTTRVYAIAYSPDGQRLIVSASRKLGGLFTSSVQIWRRGGEP
jgi:WD40 repeat protein